MRTFILLVLMFGVGLNHALRLPESDDRDIEGHRIEPEVLMDACGLATSKGYPCEVYKVQTEDGYILELHRIRHGKNGDQRNIGEPVFLQHGLLCDSSNWVTNLENQSFAFLLADSGYDVWMGNNRGNTYAKEHVKWTSKNFDFWQFSWQEMAEYDLPASIDRVLSVSKYSQIFYVGHSQGSMIAFAKLGKDQKLASKVKAIFALGPVHTVGQIKSGLINIVSRYHRQIIAGYRLLLQSDDFLPNDFTTRIAPRMCTIPVLRLLCGPIIELIAGPDYGNLNRTRIPVYVGHTPAGTSLTNMLHFAQMVKSGKSQMLDMGSATRNLNRYGQTTPPEYTLDNLNVPVYIYWGNKDILADPADIKILVSKLPARVLKGNYELKRFNHLDFIWAVNANKVLYENILQHMSKMKN